MKNETNIYDKLNIDAISIAMEVLKDSTFKIWLYMAKNQNDFTYPLYMVNVCKFCNISESTYHRGIKELIDNHYLVPTDDGNNYDFYELREEDATKIHTIKAEEF